MIIDQIHATILSDFCLDHGKDQAPDPQSTTSRPCGHLAFSRPKTASSRPAAASNTKSWATRAATTAGGHDGTHESFSDVGYRI